MKIQDIVFFSILFIIMYTKQDNHAVILGLFLIPAAFVLFIAGNIFTAQRCVMYAAGFFLWASVQGARV